MHDIVSVIEEVGDSFVSSDDLFKEFEQYGIKIENIVIDGDSMDKKIKVGQSRLSNEQPSERKNYEYDNVLDYSNMARLK